MILIPERIDPLFGTGLFFIAPGTAESSVKLVFIQGLLQGLRFHDIRVFLTTMCERADAGIYALLVYIDNKIQSKLFHLLIAELNHFAKFPGGVNVHEGER